jgi:hypothetical protein
MHERGRDLIFIPPECLAAVNNPLGWLLVGEEEVIDEKMACPRVGGVMLSIFQLQRP